MAEPKPTVYVETTIPSYLTARSTRDIVRLAHQQLTVEWWSTEQPRFDLYTSQVVLLEASRGDPEAAAKRIAALQGIPLLQTAPEVGRAGRTVSQRTADAQTRRG